MYRGIEIGERHGVLAAGMISRERTCVEDSEGRDVGRGVRQLGRGGRGGHGGRWPTRRQLPLRHKS